MKASIIERYHDRWVAIADDDVVVADAESLDLLLAELNKTGTTGTTIQRIPAVGEPLFIGLR
jgi:hypothetical protein